MINDLLRSACDSLGFHFIGNSSITGDHEAGDGIHLNYADTEVLLENIAFCLNNFLCNKSRENIESFDQYFSIKHIDRYSIFLFENIEFYHCVIFIVIYSYL